MSFFSSMPFRFSIRILMLGLFVATSLSSAVIGVNKPAESITAARIAALPKKDRAMWMAYLDRSQRQMQVDRATLAAERTPGMPEPPMPQEGFGARSIPLDRNAAWY